MKCNDDNPQNYKKPTFFEKLANFIDKLTGGTNEDSLTKEESRYIDQSFDKNFIWKKKKEIK